MTTLALAAYRVFTELHETEKLATDLSKIEFQMHEQIGLIAPWAREIQDIRRKLTACERLLAEMGFELARVKSTVSWRVTAPLRVIWNFYLKLTGEGGNVKTVEAHDRSCKQR